MRCKATPLKKIREHCLGCCCGSPKEVKYCPLTDCPIWLYRFGRRPESAIHRLGTSGKDLLDEANFKDGAMFDPNKPISMLGA